MQIKYSNKLHLLEILGYFRAFNYPSSCPSMLKPSKEAFVCRCIQQ